MSENWPRRRASSGGYPRYPEYNHTRSHSDQMLYTNPPPPLNYTLPPPCYPITTTHPSTYHYPDPQGVSPPAGPELDHSDIQLSRPHSSLSQNSTFTTSMSPSSISTTSSESYSTCCFCSSVFLTSSLYSHLTTSHSSFMFHCRALCPASPGTVCGQQFLSVPQLRSHLYTQHMVTTFSSDKLARVGTIILPTDLRMYRCKRCPPDQGTFYGSAEPLLSSHLASLHPEVRGSAFTSRVFGYECRACDKYQLDDEIHLLKHIKLRHSRTREPSVELIPGPVIQPSSSPEYVAQDISPDGRLGAQTCDADASSSLTRCNMCPSPGLVHRDQITSHQRSHNTTLFTCAPCKMKFEQYQDVESHIKVRHNVSQANSIMESIVLPSREQLVTLQCGVCGKQFVGQGEQVLVSHIETTHGKYYVGVGGGKNLLRYCRICEESGGDGGEMLKHLDSKHGSEMFADDSDTDDEDVKKVKLEAVVVSNKPTSHKVAFMDIFKEEVARRKAENDKQEIEMKRLRKILSSDSSGSEIEEIKVVKKKKRDKKKKSKMHSSGSEDIKTRKREKRKLKLRSEEDNIDRIHSKLQPTSSDDSVPYKYKKCSNKSSNNDLKPCAFRNIIKDEDINNVDLLQLSSTEKLLEAKELVRISIQEEEDKQKEASVSFSRETGSFQNDLSLMKEQLSETLRRSREITQQEKLKPREERFTRERVHKNSHIPSQSKLSKSELKIISVSPPRQSVPVEPKLARFKMTWKKK